MRIDAHTHLFAPAQVAARAELVERDPAFAEMYGDAAARMATAPDLIAAMDRAGLDAAVVAGFAFGSGRDIDVLNEYVLGEARHPLLVPLATVNQALPGWRATAERALLAGARGFGELRPHNQGWDPLGPESLALCGLARDAGVPLLWHVSEPVGHAYPGKAGGIDPVELIRLATLAPGTKMVAAHLGGGLAHYLQMPEVREACRDIYFDTAASALLYDDGSIPRLVGLAGPERVLFASDYPLQSPRRQLERILALVPPGCADAVCGLNAHNLFRETELPNDRITS